MTTGDDMRKLALRLAVRAQVQPKLTPAVREHLIAILAYIGPDEEKDWMQRGRPEDGYHIWLSVRSVWNWLNQDDAARDT